MNIASIAARLKGAFGFVTAEQSVTGRLRKLVGSVDVVDSPIYGGRAAAIGDSITEFGPASYFHAMCNASGGRMRRAINAGIGGQTTTQMLARIETSIPASACIDHLFIGGGTNDPGAGISLDTTLNNFEAMSRYALSIGATPYIICPPPKAVEGICRIASALPCLAARLGVPLINPWLRFYGASGGWSSGASSDGTHPTAATADAAGKSALDQIARLVGNNFDGLNYSGFWSNGLFNTNLLLPDSNSDGLPDNWYLFSNGLPSSSITTTAATLPSVGNTFKIACAAGSSGTQIYNRKITTTIPAGHRMAISARVTTTGYSSGAYGHFRLNFSGGPTVSAIAIDNLSYGADLTDAVVYAEVVLDAPCTDVVMQARLQLASASASGSISISQPQVFDLTALGISG